MLNKLVKFRFATTNLKSDSSKIIYEKLQKQQNLVVSKDGYQVNIGIIFERKPIFIQADEIEMKSRKMRYMINKKYNLYPNIPKEMFDFSIRGADIIPMGTDEIPTHMIFDEQKQERTFYYSNSKNYQFVDYINNKNPQSIQYMACYFVYLLIKQQDTAKWGFPKKALQENQTLEEARYNLMAEITQNKWTASWRSQLPFAVHREEYPNNQDLRIKGSKTFYFMAQHVEGQIQLGSKYEGEFNWVPRGHMNKYLEEDMYQNIIPALTP